MGTIEDCNVVIFGASPMAESAAAIAKMMDFPVTVLDDEPEKFELPGFAGCDCRVVDFLNMPAYEELGITADSMLVVVTRGHKYDRQCFVYGMRSEAFYCGMIGKPKKIEVCCNYARENGCTEEQINHCTFPIGVNIGAIDAKEIGLAIAAQLVEQRNIRFPREKDHESLHAK